MNIDQKPEAPATECACRKALKAAREEIGRLHLKMANGQYLSAFDNITLFWSIVDPALATPCPCTELREDVEQADKDRQEMSAEIVKLRAELAAAHSCAAHVAVGQLGTAHAQRDAAHRQLAEAVEALRECAQDTPWHHSCSDGDQEDTCITCCRRRCAAAIVARFDAQEGREPL